MKKPVEHGGGHYLVAEHFSPGIETLVAGNDDRGFLVEFAHQAEEVVGLFAINRGVADLVNDKQIAIQYPTKAELAGALNRRGSEQPHEAVHPLKAHGVAAVNGGESQANGKMGLADSRGTEEPICFRGPAAEW